MKEIQLQYKRETGLDPECYAEDQIDYDQFDVAEIYDPYYVEWLEDKNEQLQKQRHGHRRAADAAQ